MTTTGPRNDAEAELSYVEFCADSSSSVEIPKIHMYLRENYSSFEKENGAITVKHISMHIYVV